MDELATATEIAVEAGALVLSYFGSDRVDARAKGERDVVTAADTASEALVLRRLRGAFPDDGVVAEEGGHRTSSSGRRWFVDPLDGTLNYAHGIPIWCVSISLFEGERPILGVIHDPILSETFTAVVHRGTSLNGVALGGSGVTEAADALVHVTIDFNEASLNAGLEDIRELAPRVLRTRNIGSAALALAYVAAGRFDAMVHRLANTWDYGAGMLMVQEAGGVATAIDGSPYESGTEAVLAAGSPELHGALEGILSPTTAHE